MIIIGIIKRLFLLRILKMINQIRIALIIVVVCAMSIDSIAQRGNTAWTKYKHEISVGYGFNTFLASIGANDKIGTRFMLQRSTFNASYRYYLKKHFAVRGSFTHAYSRKNDKDIIDPANINMRLDYESTISELGGKIEYHIRDETTMGRSNKGKVRRSRGGMTKGIDVGLSIFGGVGIDYFRPVAEYYGDRMVLKKYDAQAGFITPKDYRRVHIHFPVGAQARLVLGENWRLGLEACYRIGITNYIDNASSVYYADGNPFPERYTDYPDKDFAGGYVFMGNETGSIPGLASQTGRKNYFVGMMTLSYRIKSSSKK